jgi:hypothetical protein
MRPANYSNAASRTTAANDSYASVKALVRFFAPSNTEQVCVSKWLHYGTHTIANVSVLSSCEHRNVVQNGRCHSCATPWNLEVDAALLTAWVAL